MPPPPTCTPSSKTASSQAVCSTPMGGEATRAWRRRAISGRLRSCGGAGRNLHADAPCSPDCFVVEALVTRYPPRRGGASTPAILPRRIHLSLQPSEVEKPRQALLPAHATGRQYRSENVRHNGGPRPITSSENTTGWGS